MEDYKEKYEQALENIKRIKAANKDNKELVDFIEYNYPELKESEDERVRKELIDYCHERLNTTYGALPNIETIKRWLAWLEKPKYTEEDLDKAYKCADEVQYRHGYEDAKKEIEKQGEQNLTRPIWKYKKDHTPLLRDSFILNKYGCVAKSPSGALVSDVWVLDFDELAKLPKEEFERQGEQKPAWSEKDDYTIERLFCLLDNEQDNYPQLSCNFQEIEEIKNWLKSLKERMKVE